MKLRETEVLMHVDGLTRTRLKACVREAWICPGCDDDGEVFDDTDVARLRLICELTEDMMVNDDAVPIILSLVDQLHGLRRDVAVIERALREEDARVRGDIMARIRHILAEQ